MFPARYFCVRAFAPTYFPKVGATPVVPASGPGDSYRARARPYAFRQAPEIIQPRDPYRAQARLPLERLRFRAWGRVLPPEAAPESGQASFAQPPESATLTGRLALPLAPRMRARAFRSLPGAPTLREQRMMEDMLLWNSRSR